MNKVVNVFSFVILIVFTLMGMTIIMDLAISNFHLRAMPYKVETMSLLAVLLFLLGLVRVRRRWQGVKDMNSFEQFEYETEVSKTFLKRERMASTLETLFMIAALTFFIRLAFLEADLMLVMIGALSVLILESIIFLFTIKPGKTFRIGLNEKVIAYFGREMHLYFYTGLQRVELFQNDTISFKYEDDLVLLLPISVIKEQDRVKFREALLPILDEKNIYYDDAIRNLK
jgi:hypothetical protein